MTTYTDEDRSTLTGQMYEDDTFVRCVLLVDENTYARCTFTECRLIYTGSYDIAMGGCHFEAVNFTLAGAAENTVRFLAGVARIEGGGRDLVQSFFAHILAGSVPNEGETRPQGVTLQ